MKKFCNTKLGNYACSAMLLLVLITQFMPFWLCTDCKDHKEADKVVSIAEYTWLPDHHKPITKGMTNVYLGAYGPDYTDEDGKKYAFAVDDIILPLAVILLGSVVGATLCLVFANRWIVTGIPLLVGAVGTYWYIVCPAMHAGANWPIHLVIAILTTIVALATCGFSVRNYLWKRS